MKNQLEEIKRLAVSEIKKTHSFFKGGAPDMEARAILMTTPEYQLATRCLKLIQQAEKLAEALRRFESSGYGWLATEALAEFEQWKRGDK